MPTGGVSVDNAAEWIKAGAVALGAGSSLTAGAKTGDYAKITEAARQFIQRIQEQEACRWNFKEKALQMHYYKLNTRF